MFGSNVLSLHVNPWGFVCCCKLGVGTVILIGLYVHRGELSQRPSTPVTFPLLLGLNKILVFFRDPIFTMIPEFAGSECGLPSIFPRACCLVWSCEVKQFNLKRYQEILVQNRVSL